MGSCGHSHEKLWISSPVADFFHGELQICTDDYTAFTDSQTVDKPKHYDCNFLKDSLK
jgi:hypothetical protein